jgi:hypothetical protein
MVNYRVERGGGLMADVIRLPPQGGHRSNADRNAELFKWALDLLQRLGLDRAVQQAATVEELRNIVLDLDDAAIILAIRDVLHPASGKRDDLFVGLTEKGLGPILKNRLADLKKDREAALGGRARERTWQDDLIFNDDGKALPRLANLILILTHSPAWQGVLGYDEFANLVVIRKRLPWGTAPGTPWSDHLESLTRSWFQRSPWDINAPIGDTGRAIQAAARANTHHPVRERFDALRWDEQSRLDTWLITYLGAPPPG